MLTDFPHLPIVQGWLNNYALLFTSFYTTTFLRASKFSSLEIGVHHGKFFIGLENITPANGKAIAVDIFNSQQKNIDGSGKGDLEIFKGHVYKFCKDPSRVIIKEIDSLDIDASEIGINQFGLLSIDGGHTPNHTINDLEICNTLVTETGLIILDDILNQDWAGVVTGAVQHFSSNTGKRIVPLAIGFNKLFCCHFTSKERILKELVGRKEELKGYGINISKFTEFCGHRILSLKQ